MSGTQEDVKSLRSPLGTPSTPLTDKTQTTSVSDLAKSVDKLKTKDTTQQEQSNGEKHFVTSKMARCPLEMICNIKSQAFIEDLSVFFNSIYEKKNDTVDELIASKKDRDLWKARAEISPRKVMNTLDFFFLSFSDISGEATHSSGDRTIPLRKIVDGFEDLASQYGYDYSFAFMTSKDVCVMRLLDFELTVRYLQWILVAFGVVRPS
ncbi:unnamed protein product [Caenorhabditis brenneri]